MVEKAKSAPSEQYLGPAVVSNDNIFPSCSEEAKNSFGNEVVHYMGHVMDTGLAV